MISRILRDDYGFVIAVDLISFSLWFLLAVLRGLIHEDATDYKGDVKTSSLPFQLLTMERFHPRQLGG